MAIDVTCECGKKFTVEDQLVGRRRQCPDCQQKLRLPSFLSSDTANPNREREESAESPFKMFASESGSNRKLSPSETKEMKLALQATKVPLGIDCIYSGFLLFILVSVLGVLAMLALGDNPRSLLFALRAVGCLAFAANILTTFGLLSCLTAPPQMPGEGSIRVAVLIDLLALTITVAGFFTVVPPLLSEVIRLLSVVGYVCVVLFLRQLGDSLGVREISEGAAGVLKWSVRIFVLWLSLIAMSMLAQANVLPGDAAGKGILLLGIALVVVGIIGVIRYENLLSTCRDTLANG